MPPSKIDSDTAVLIVQDYQAMVPIPEIKSRYQITSDGAIYRVLTRAGLKPSRRPAFDASTTNGSSGGSSNGAATGEQPAPDSAVPARRRGRPAGKSQRRPRMVPKTDHGVMPNVAASGDSSGVAQTTQSWPVGSSARAAAGMPTHRYQVTGLCTVEVMAASAQMAMAQAHTIPDPIHVSRIV